MGWNQPKLERMVEHARALNLGLRDLNERRNDARARLRGLQTEVDEYSNPTARVSPDRFKVRDVPPVLQKEYTTARQELERLADAHAEAEAHWQRYGAVVTNLRQYAEQNLGFRGAR